jgi:hypothetical protein
MSLSLHFLEREKTGSGLGLLLCVSSLPCTKEIESNEEHRIRRERGLFLSENIFDNHEEMLPTKIDREVN